ncbi:MAG: hypothetical protein FJ186_03970 [Gammaproteobacteria bacterium]|nr:hypothetical protein [Gammaproteobacteria bacterium]
MKEFNLFSIICKNELESNFDKIIEILNSKEVTEETITRVYFLWESSLNLTETFIKHQPWHCDERESALTNLRVHFRNYLQEKDAYSQAHFFLSHRGFCGWVGQMQKNTKLDPDNQIRANMYALIGSLSDYDAIFVLNQCFYCAETYQSTLDSHQIKQLIKSTEPVEYSIDLCRSHVEMVLQKTSFKPSESTLIQFFMLIPFLLFLYALTFEIYPALILSLFSMLLLNARFNTLLDQESIIEKTSQNAIEDRVYVEEKASDKMIQAIAKCKGEALRVRHVKEPLSVNPSIATCIPSCPILTKDERQAISDENQLSAEHARSI